MKERYKIFILAIIASASCWWGFNIFQNNVENLMAKIIASPKNMLTAQISLVADNQTQTNASQDTISQSTQPAPPLTPENFLGEAGLLTAYNATSNQEEILFSKNAGDALPIASISKLMTAVIATELNLTSQDIKISQRAFDQSGEVGNLKVDETITGNDLLKIMLIGSSNDVAFAFAELLGENNFISLMNLKAKEIGLTNTAFFNPNGLDPQNTEQTNFSSARDLTKLTQYLIKNHPEILAITAEKNFELTSTNSSSTRSVQNTNELLNEYPEIIGGKTGLTNSAGGCLLEILQTDQPNIYLIAVVLSSNDRFNAMRQLINNVITNVKKLP